ncbi:MAG: NAD-dependent epimerase/dehydratase family protein [Bacteroidetes bacterium]|nr:NAD-dependent epimerase/dehydratase family protein [Bacteroidota bacterium]MBS1541839.1 NAD-dependent epimerase/dehydratase family protein [Bacteroidota bacterium]
MIAITGASGLLGNFITRKFISSGETVVGIKRNNSDLSMMNDISPHISWREADITDSRSLVESFQGVHTVIHAAALVSFDPRDKEKIFSNNVEGTQNVVNACLSANVKRLIYISSVAALGRKKGNFQLDEESKWEESSTNSDYAQSKYLAELEIYRGREEGLSVSIVCPSVILAPANRHKSSAQLFNYVLNERKFYSEATINFVDARDVAEMVWSVFKKPAIEKVIANAGTVPLKELLSQIALRLDKKAPTIKINKKILRLAAWLEEWRCRLTGQEMLISRQSVKSAQGSFTYVNKKSVDQLGMRYTPLSETLDWCCAHYRHLQ